jgi:hypothetical protein
MRSKHLLPFRVLYSGEIVFGIDGIVFLLRRLPGLVEINSKVNEVYRKRTYQLAQLEYRVDGDIEKWSQSDSTRTRSGEGSRPPLIKRLIFPQYVIGMENGDRHRDCKRSAAYNMNYYYLVAL